MSHGDRARLQDFLAARRPFVPPRWLGNGHAMTVFTWARKREYAGLPESEPRLFRVAPDTQVLARCYWQPRPADAPTVLVLHGLEGSTEAHYMRGVAAKAWRRGWNAVLLNQRNCGGTEQLTPTLYHSGLTADPAAVIRELSVDLGLSAFGVVGYSLGGNLAVKLAGELAERPDLPVVGAVAISPIIDIERCVHAIERRRNFVYQFKFVRQLRERMRRKARYWPDAFDLRRLDAIWTIRTFDDVYTAPSHGYQGASDYYHRASAMRIVDRIQIPTLILAAEDDPFVPAPQFREPAVQNNPNVTVWLEKHGGHCGFIQDWSKLRGGQAPRAVNSEDDGYWAETTAIDFLTAVMPR